MQPSEYTKDLSSFIQNRLNMLPGYMQTTFPMHKTICRKYDELVENIQDKLSTEDWALVKQALSAILFRTEAESTFYYVQGVKDCVYAAGFLDKAYLDHHYSADIDEHIPNYYSE